MEGSIILNFISIEIQCSNSIGFSRIDPNLSLLIINGHIKLGPNQVLNVLWTQ